MPIPIDIWWVLMVGCLDFAWVIDPILKQPLFNDIDRFPTSFDCPLLTKEIERLFKVLREDIDRSFNHPIAPILKPNKGKTKILSLNKVMHEVISHPKNFNDFIAHHPTQKVDVVD